jgi:hypothetical protein
MSSGHVFKSGGEWKYTWFSVSTGEKPDPSMVTSKPPSLDPLKGAVFAVIITFCVKLKKSSASLAFRA